MTKNQHILSFFKDKNVFITGHTGFKGSWLSFLLLTAGANVTGYSLEAPTDPGLFSCLGLESKMTSIIADIRDRKALTTAFSACKPEIVLHLAAQPIVRESYEHPVETYEANVLGTVYLLECIRTIPCVKSFLNVTTDKVYLNVERDEGYKEDEPLDGFDPYSNSKSCSELVTHSYKNSFFSSDAGNAPAISTARAGNVIGGGDFAKDRIIPDCVRAVQDRKKIIVRNPHSVRPYQHVLEPLFAYLMIASKQYDDPAYAGWYNVGPDDEGCITTSSLVDLFCSNWGNEATWENRFMGGPHEASFLRLNCSKLKSVFGWSPTWSMDTAVSKTCEWYRDWMQGRNIEATTADQIQEFIGG